jgi:hypothetical protein
MARGFGQPVQGAPPAGVNYVVGTPAQTPVLRPLRQPIFDTEVYPAGGIATLRLFTNSTTFAAGGAKLSRHTNMTQSGQLGTPLEFDLVGFNVEIERGTSKDDHDTLYRTGQFIWFFGQNTIWLNVPLSRIPEGIGLYGQISQDGNAAPVEKSVLVNGWPIVQNLYNFTTPDRMARRVTSTESFRAQIDFPDVPTPTISVNTEVRAYMLGILYTQL